MNDGENVMEQLAIELMTKKGLSSHAMGQAVYEQFKEDLIDRMEDVVNGVIFNALQQNNKIEEFEKLLDNGDDTTAFINHNIPDIDKLTAQALVNFCDSY